MARFLRQHEAINDKQLRTTVKLLGTLLGNVIKTHAGKEVYNAVEKLRKGFIGLRENESSIKHDQLIKYIGKLNRNTLTDVIRSYSKYFALVNVTEEAFQHINRERRLKSGYDSWDGSFDSTLRDFVSQKIDKENLQVLLNHLKYIPVFTAHPTEAKRRSEMHLMRRIFAMILELQQYKGQSIKKEELLEKLESEILILWKTDEVRLKKPTVIDEVENGLYYFRTSLFKAIPQIYRDLEKAIYRTMNAQDHFLQTTRVNINNPYDNMDFLKISEKPISQYNQYIENFIKVTGSPIKNSAEIIIEGLNNYLKSQL